MYLFRVTGIRAIVIDRGEVFTSVFVVAVVRSPERIRTRVTDADVFPTLLAVYVNATGGIAAVPFSSPRFWFAANETLAPAPREPCQPAE